MRTDFGAALSVDTDSERVEVVEEEDEVLRALSRDDWDALRAWIQRVMAGNFDAVIAPSSRVARVLRWARDQACGAFSILAGAAAFGAERCVRGLLDMGAGVTPAVVEAAMYGGSGRICDWLDGAVNEGPVSLALACVRGWSVRLLEHALGGISALPYSDYWALMRATTSAVFPSVGAQIVAWSRRDIDWHSERRFEWASRYSRVRALLEGA